MKQSEFICIQVEQVKIRTFSNLGSNVDRWDKNYTVTADPAIYEAGVFIFSLSHFTEFCLVSLKILDWVAVISS